MAQAKEIRKRIQVVRSIKQITRAMKMVAGARVKKAQQLAEGNRPYEAAIERMLDDLLQDLSLPWNVVHEFCEVRPTVKTVGLMVVTSDKGLCGSLNSNMIRYSHRWCCQKESEGKTPVLFLCGRKANEYFKKRPYRIEQYFSGIFKTFSYPAIQEISKLMGDAFRNFRLDEIYIAYHRFQSIITQTITLKQLFPVTLDPASQPAAQNDIMIKPRRDILIAELLQRTVDIEVYHAMLESIASEHGARMAAMDAATKNAEDMLRNLMISYNRARQASITKELMEIVGGAEALQTG